MSDTLFEILTNQLRNDEELRLKPYADTTGHLTIGYGRNLSTEGLSKTECEFLLSNNARKAIEDAKKAIPQFDSLSVKRQSVLCNMMFNLGMPKFLTFKKMINAIAVGNFKQAKYEMLNSVWADQVGNRAIYLAEIMEDGL